MWPWGKTSSPIVGKARANWARFHAKTQSFRKGAKQILVFPLRLYVNFATLREISYKFSTMKSSIICRMCFNNGGSVTPCLDFGYSIN